MGQVENYKKLIEEIVGKQMDILGPEIALRKTKNIKGLEVDERGKVIRLDEDAAQSSLQQLVDEYITLSGAIVKNILYPVFAKYPEIKLNLPQ